MNLDGSIGFSIILRFFDDFLEKTDFVMIFGAPMYV